MWVAPHAQVVPIFSTERPIERSPSVPEAGECGFDWDASSGMAGSGSGSETQMRDTELFQAALGLGAPWSVSGSRFDAV